MKEIKKLMIVKGYSQNTISTYIACLSYFKNHFKGSNQLTNLNLTQNLYLTHLACYNNQRKIADLFIEDLMQDFELYVKQGDEKK